MLRILCLILCAGVFLAPQTAQAWGKLGHRVVGEIAQNHLSPDAQQAVQDILGVEDLAESSSWPDFMRSSSDPFWREEAYPYHFVTVPPGETYSEVGAPPEGDAATALKKFTATLRDETASLEDKQLALRFIVHIIGDLHQPLHVGKGDDRGGNDVKLIWFDEPTNLHMLWDEKLIQHEELSYTEMAEWLNRRITTEKKTAWSNADPLVWIAEAAEMRDSVYPEYGQDLKWDYFFAQRDLMREQLSKGGARLAAYLNAVYAP